MSFHLAISKARLNDLIRCSVVLRFAPMMKNDPMVEGGESEELFLIKDPLNTFNLYTIRVFREMVFQLVVGLTGVPLDAHPEYTTHPR